MKNHSKISLSKANFFDIEFLWYLRNQPDVYRYSRNSRPISWKEHIDWILPVILGKSNKNLFVVKNSKTPIGQIRFDWMNNKEAEVSISILKEFQGKDFATRFLDLAIKKFRKQRKALKLVAEINENNISSIKLFEKYGFKIKTKKGIWLKYILNL